MRPSAVIQAMDCSSIYAVPIDYHKEGLDAEVLDVFGMGDAPKPDLSRWEAIDQTVNHPDGEVTIAVVGKYTVLKDAYKSLIEALHHGGLANKVKVNLDWVESETFEGDEGAAAARLENAHAIMVPGGFGERGAEGKIRAAQFARERKVPVLRHLLRHADGGHRGAEERGGRQGRLVQRVRPHRASRGRHHDRVDQGQRDRPAPQQ